MSSLGGALPTPPRRAQYERTPLHLAASNGHVEVVKELLEHGAKIEAKDVVRQEGVRVRCVHMCACTAVQVVLAIPPRTLRACLEARSHRRRAAHRAT